MPVTTMRIPATSAATSKKIAGFVKRTFTTTASPNRVATTSVETLTAPAVFPNFPNARAIRIDY